MSQSSDPAGDTVEGNLSEIDTDAKFIKLEDRTGKVFIKIFYKPAHEERIRKQKVGYYEAPLVTLEENTGGLQEAVLIDLPYKSRPADFPKMQRHGGQQGGRPYTPRNEKIIVAQCLLKCWTELWQHTNIINQNPDHDKTFADARAEILEAVEADLQRVMTAGGA
jgi:hypothetical protein